MDKKEKLNKENTTKYYCQECGKELKQDERPCPYCGSNKREIKTNLYENIRVGESLGIKKYDKSNLKKWIQKSISGWFSSGDKKKYPEGVERTMSIDRTDPNRDGSYKEKVIDLATGEVVRDVEEKLIDHRHGEKNRKDVK